jgi:predicted amidohydrolase YtcJ
VGRSAWITGSGYDETLFVEGRSPEARDLDRVSTEQPVMVWRADRHSSVCNTRALELAGITADTPDPPGARFERDDHGRPNGILTEREATRAVSGCRPAPDRAVRVRQLRAAGERLLSRGIVGVCDMMATSLEEPLQTYRDAHAEGPFPVAGLFLGWDPDAPLDDLVDEDRSGGTRIAGAKVLMDGTYSNRTAWVCEPYPDSADRGMRTIGDDDLRAAAAWCRRNGVQLAVHAMGDRAIRHVVGVLGDDEPWLDDRPSVRIEHATLMDRGLVEAVASARVRFGIATHSIFFFAEYDAYARNLRPELVDDAYPLARLYSRIDSLALSSDCPATAWSDADDVFISVQAAVTRQAHTGAVVGGPAALTVPQAILLYTSRAARLAGMHDLGVLAPGRSGSLVVLDRDVFSVPEDEIAQVRVDETWLDGDLVHSR